MAKRKVFTPELQRYMRKAGYDWRYHELVNDQTRAMLVKDKRSGLIFLVRNGQQAR